MAEPTLYLFDGFNLLHAGGFGSPLGTGYWRHVSRHNVCGRYTGPPLFGLVKACTAPDGSNWALQVWQRELRDNGWIRGGLPRMYTVQATGCAPVVQAFESGAERARITA